MSDQVGEVIHSMNVYWVVTSNQTHASHKGHSTDQTRPRGTGAWFKCYSACLANTRKSSNPSTARKKNRPRPSVLIELIYERRKDSGKEEGFEGQRGQFFPPHNRPSPQIAQDPLGALGPRPLRPGTTLWMASPLIVVLLFVCFLVRLGFELRLFVLAK
jgi:hypothetical protein